MTVSISPVDIINTLPLTELRSQYRGSLPVRDARRFANLGSRVPLDLSDSLADFAFLGNVTHNKNARKFREQICQLSGAKDDGHISDFQSELVEVRFSESERPRQAIFLKPIKASIKPEDEFIAQSPVIIWDSGSEISVVKPSLINPGKYLITTIHKELNALQKAEEILIEFINSADENNLSSKIRLVTEKEYASTVIKVVSEKIK